MRAKWENIEVINIGLDEGFMCCDAVITVRNNNDFELAYVHALVNYTTMLNEKQD